MRFTTIIAGLLIFMCGCDRKAPTTDAPPPVKPEPPASTLPTTPTKARVVATKEQIGSCVRVRVIAGALPVKNVTGAILSRQELPAAENFFDQNRCVVAQLNGWTEAQLRSDQARILIFRNLPDAQGQLGSNLYPGKLLQFDEKSGIALITFFQGFSATTDLGFTIDRANFKDLQAVALRLGSAAGGEPTVHSTNTVSRQTIPAMKVVEGTFNISPKGSAELEFPRGEQFETSDEAALIASTPASLLGFASETGTNTADLVRIPPLEIAVQVPTIIPVSATFANYGVNSARMALKFERKNGAETLARVALRKIVLPGGTKMDLAALPKPFTPITNSGGSESWMSVNGEDKPIETSLTAPERDNEEITYLMQLAWATSDTEKVPSLFSRPFLVKLTRKPIGVIATTEGIAGPANAPPEPQGQVMTFPLEAPVVRIFEIAEGREVLMQLLGDPFWKRFSMEKREWLPLPPMNYSTADLAGNRSSLIILDRGATEVRRYQLSDLKLVATAKLNLSNEQVFAIRAGCLSDRAPIHVLCSKGPVSLDAETLQRIEDSDARGEGSTNAETAADYRASGDGVSLFTNGPYGGCLTFRGSILGLRSGYFDSAHCSFRGGGMVCAGFNLEGGTISTCANPDGEWKKITELARPKETARAFIFQSAPVIARFVNGDKRSIPPIPPQMELISLWNPEPIAVLPVPELAQIMGDNGEERASKHLVCVDLQSRRLGLLSPDQKIWSVRDFELKQEARQPVISNWPDAFVNRGDEFRFKPRLISEGRISAELLGAKEPTPVTVDEKGISFRVAANELASLLLLNLTVSGKGGNTVSSIPIYVGGAPLPFVWPDLNPGINPDDFAAGFKSLLVSKNKRVALKSNFYASHDRVLEILGPTNGILGLVTDARRVDFLALDSHKIVGSIPSPENAKYYAGSDALFEYDTNTRSLTRITVPDGRRGASFSLPADLSLEGIALGEHRDQPISLFLVRRQNERSAQFGDWNFTTWQTNRAMAVVNSETLKGGDWMQPQVWTDGSSPNVAEEALNLMTFGQKFPARIVGSHNGSILQLRNYFGLITPRFSLVAPYPKSGNQSADLYFSSPKAEGSITGIVATSSGGAISRNGIIEESLGALGTPCGRYVLVRADSTIGTSGSFEVRSIENRQPIFRLNRLAALRSDPEQGNFGSATGIQMLQDNGPAVVRSRGNKLLQFVELDIPRLAAEVAPDNFHVTSQPTPILIEGGTYEYQVKVNNPSLVTGYKLREPPPNATISPSGMLRFSSPQNVRAPSRMPLSIEIAGKNGTTILHNFSVIVISHQLPSSPPAQSKPPQTPPSNNLRRL